MATLAIRSGFPVHIRMLRRSSYAALLVIAVLVGAFNLFSLNEAYGDGPPYYARTTNMDKWTDPLPILAAVDAFALLVIFASLCLALRKR
ncbi:hypothetical protein AWB80_03695 [Caballeronia pedi]|uniref:Uncharacterized protein n=2 Tax=Caballeronia pedi TaxID=1777141 RepID=A0A158BMU0_9BURK|nr:hypothetical protein AWB80_03695 [Caballeronia pedi]